ncbi:hypothetical protein CJ738_36455, partial [Klebsiella pneumoniae]
FAGGSDKKIPLAKVESLFSIRHENGAVEFFREALSPAVFAGGSDKKIPLAKVESLFSIRHENGAVEFFREA